MKLAFYLASFLNVAKGTMYTEYSSQPQNEIESLESLEIVKLKSSATNEGGRCRGKHYSCGQTIRDADVGKTMLVESPKYPSKVTCGVNCVIKLQTEPDNKIIIRWRGFLIDGCHEGNKMRITDGDLQKSYCGDELPPVFVSKNNVIEIAFSVVDMGREDRGIYYRFTYEASETGQLKPKNGWSNGIPTNSVRLRPRANKLNKTTRTPKQQKQLTTHKQQNHHHHQQQQQQQGHHQQQQQGHQQQQQQQQQAPQQSNQKPQKSKQKPHEVHLKKDLRIGPKTLRKNKDFTAYNYNVRYQSRDYEHSNNQPRQPISYQYETAELELLEELEELEDLENEITTESVKPYILVILAVILIIGSLVLILRTIFCKSNGLNEDIKQFT